MIPIIIAGLGIGLGLAAIVWGLCPPPLTLRAALDRLTATDPDAVDPPDPVSSRASSHRTNGARRRAGRAASKLVDGGLAKIPSLAAVVTPDLAICGTAMESFALKVVGCAIGLGLSGPILVVGLHEAHIRPGLEVPAFAVVVLAMIGAALPFFDLHQAAEKRRRHFLHTLATYSSLVSMAIAGSMGWSSALEVAASVSDSDWTMSEISQALLWAQAYRKQPWEGLDRLAQRYRLTDLTDLARSMSQAGDGARIRDSLEAKAQSLRRKEMSVLEEAAQAVTQKMLLPGVLLMAGYGVLILYPALANFTGAHL